MKIFKTLSTFFHRRKFIIFFLSYFLVLLSFTQEKERSTSPHSKCLSCHGHESTCEEKFQINEENFFSSVHRDLECTDCHQVSLIETEQERPHKKNLPAVNCTQECHQESKQIKTGLSPAYYPDSVHGKAYLERGIQEVAKCWDCHTKHNIREPSDLNSAVNRKNIPLTCSTCHEDMNVIVKYNIHCEQPYQEYMQSVHGKALFKDGLLFFAAVCTDCHGVHNIKGVGDPSLAAKNPKTCGQCHILIFNEYSDSIHGREALKGNIFAPLCVDCHDEHKIISPGDEEAPTSFKNVSDTCSTCHSRPEIIQKYGIPKDRTESFIQSLHGIAIGYGYKAAANCSSCHGVHDILPAENPLSRVNPANLAKTCGQENCHPGMPEKIANSKIHIDASQKKSGAPYYIQQILLWIVLAIVIITLIWFSAGFIRKIKLIKK